MKEMKKIESILLYAAALVMLWACSSSDDGNAPVEGVTTTPSATPPVWEVKMNMPQGDVNGKPNWDWDEGEDPDFNQFENHMTAILSISDETLPFTSDDDRVAAIVDGEVRDVVPRVPYGDGYAFMLFIPYDAEEDLVEIQYYNAKTDMTYLMAGQFSVHDDAVGNDEEFLFSCFQYVMVDFTLLNQPFQCQPGDKMAVFVGETCYGVCEYVDEHTTWTLNVFEPNEKVDFSKATVRYYSGQKKTIYSTALPLYPSFTESMSRISATFNFK